jgi:chorismate dehydratase
MVSLSAVSYLNTKPFIYGIYRTTLGDRIQLSLDIPARCAEKLRDGEVDLALAPVAVIPELKKAFLVSDFCIGSIGAVQTVCLYAHKPLELVREIYLDFHSRTSARLVQLLCQHYWKLSPNFRAAKPGYEKQVHPDAAALIIGDRTIGMEHHYPYVYDLGEAWYNWTGLPFVYAAWISTKPLPGDFVTEFNQALKAGLDHLPELSKIIPAVPNFDIQAYFEKYISYPLDDAKWEGLCHFLELIEPGSIQRLSRKFSTTIV